MRVTDTNTFIQKAKIIHGDKYDYSLTNYVRGTLKVKIICPKHGEFEQIPTDHTRKSGCRHCTQNMDTKDEFVQKSIDLHGKIFNYDLVKYKNAKTEVKIKCKNGHVFEQLPYVHLRGNGCTFCTHPYKNFTKEKFIQEANTFHLNKYEYTKANYINHTTKLIVTCPIHGDFNVRPDVHLKHGCRLCSHFSLGWTQDKFEERCKKNNKGLGIFYILKCWDETEIFYKVGITSKSIKQRYNSPTAMPYNYKIIQEIQDVPANVWALEKYCKKFKDINSIQYRPLTTFAGSLTECYKIKDN